MTDAISTTGAVPLGDEQAGRVPILGQDSSNPLSARNMFLALGATISVGQAVPVDPKEAVLPTVLITFQGQKNGGDQTEELRVMLPPVLADQIEEALGEALEELHTNADAMKAEAAAETARRAGDAAQLEEAVGNQNPDPESEAARAQEVREQIAEEQIEAMRDEADERAEAAPERDEPDDEVDATVAE
jgi:hypothetical protein